MNNIVLTFAESQKLDEQIIERLRFELIEKQGFTGYTEKYFLKGNDDNLWLFKTYPSDRPAKISKSIYLLLHFLGISSPVVYEIRLPINGKLVYGSIQKFIPGCIGLDNVPINKLNDEQIAIIQKCQVFDWLVFNNDSTADHFIVEPQKKELIVIDRDESFTNIKDAIFVGEDPWKSSYYTEFWEAYLRGTIDINFKNTFEFIEYIQNIDNNEFKKIVSQAVNSDEVIEEFLFRKKNLKVNFESFYQKKMVLKGVKNRIFSKNKKRKYSKAVLKKTKKTVVEKRKMLKNLESKTLIKQENIVIISSKDAWFAVEKLNYCPREKFNLGVKKAFEQLEYLYVNALNISEELAINLYMKEVEKTCKKKDIENFVHREIKRITMHPAQITDKKILNIEYNLRSIYGENRKLVTEYKQELENNCGNVLAHLNYIQYPIFDKFREEEKNLLKNYKQKIDRDENNLIAKFIYGILLKDVEYLENLDNNFDWKYIGIALLHSVNGDREKAIQFANKACGMSKNSSFAYWVHMFLGLLYEYNSQWERYGEGFEAEKAVIEYKKAFLINSKSVKAHLNLGVLYLINKKADEALNEFKEVNKLDPQYGREHFHFDKIKKKSSYKNEKEYLEAVRINTLSGQYHYILGLAYAVKKEEELANKHFNKAEQFGYKKTKEKTGNKNDVY